MYQCNYYKYGLFMAVIIDLETLCDAEVFEE